MSITVTPITDTCKEVAGLRNTAGEPELYRVTDIGHGQYNVTVQRKNGKFAFLNQNVHAQTINRVIRAMKGAN